MRARWMRTALTCLGIVLGVSVILAIAVTNDSTLKSIRNVFDEASGRASLAVQASSADGGGFDEGIVPRVRAMPGVLVVAPSLSARTLLARDANNWQIAFGIGGQAAGNTLTLMGIDSAIDRDVRDYTLTDGRWLQGEDYEAILTQEYATEKSLRRGDDLVVLTPNGVVALRIVGLITKNGAGLINDGSIAFVPLRVAQEMFGRGSELDDLSIVTTAEIANTPAQLDALKARLTERLGKSYEVIYPAARGQLVTQMLSTYQQGLSFFSIIALFVGAFLIYNAFSMTVLERTRELGMLRALGMTRMQILGLVLTEAVVLGFIGSAIGVAFGVALARVLIVMLGAVVARDINTISVPLEGLLQSLLVGGLVTVGSALFPAVQAARVSPLEALRVAGHTSSTRVKHVWWVSGVMLMFIAWAALYPLDWRPEVRFSVGGFAVLVLMLGAVLVIPAVVEAAERVTRPLARLVFGNEGLLGSSNVRRSAARTALTVASLMVGLAMVIANSSLAAAFESDITAWIETALGGDLYVRAPLPMREQFERQLAAIPGVGGLTKIRYFPAKVAAASIPAKSAGQDTIIFAGIDPFTYRSVAEFEFTAEASDADANWRRFRAGDALFVSTVVADRYDLQLGDHLRLVTRRGEHDFEVAGIAVDFTGQGFIVTGDWEDMRRWFGQSGVDRFTLALSPGYTTATVQKSIEDKYQASRHISVETTQEFKAKIQQLSARSFRLFDVLGLIGIVVAALGVINTLMMNVIERQREIGGLRSLGLTRWQTVKMILAEATTLGAIGGLFGLVFGYFLSQVFVMSLNASSGYDLKYVFVGQLFIIGLGIALGVSQLAALYPAFRAAMVNIVEAVKHE